MASIGRRSSLVRMFVNLASMSVRPLLATGKTAGSALPVDLRARLVRNVGQGDVELTGEQVAGLQLRAQAARHQAVDEIPPHRRGDRLCPRSRSCGSASTSRKRCGKVATARAPALSGPSGCPPRDAPRRPRRSAGRAGSPARQPTDRAPTRQSRAHSVRTAARAPSSPLPGRQKARSGRPRLPDRPRRSSVGVSKARPPISSEVSDSVCTLRPSALSENRVRWPARNASRA
jgi:hypothetical protein